MMSRRSAEVIIQGQIEGWVTDQVSGGQPGTRSVGYLLQKAQDYCQVTVRMVTNTSSSHLIGTRAD